MRQVTLRLKSDQLLKEEIEKVVKEKNIKAGVLLSIVGGLNNANLRMAGSEAGANVIKSSKGPLEIVSGTGTLSMDGCHIHIAVSEHEGNVIGGHLKDGCRVRYTVEVVLLIFEDVEYKRSPDSETGYPELVAI